MYTFSGRYLEISLRNKTRVGVRDEGGGGVWDENVSVSVSASVSAGVSVSASVRAGVSVSVRVRVPMFMSWCVTQMIGCRDSIRAILT